MALLIASHGYLLAQPSQAVIEFIGDFPGGVRSTGGKGVSGSATVMVGSAWSNQGKEAFRWTAATGLVALGDLPGGIYWAEAIGISADGATIFGRSDNTASAVNSNWKLGFIWTQELGMRPLPKLSYGSSDTWPTACSADGTVVVGRAGIAFGMEAVRWVNGGPPEPLANLPGGAPILAFSTADDVSLDGSVIVGASTWIVPNEVMFQGFRWSALTGATRIPPPEGLDPEADTRAYLVSGDGQIVYARFRGDGPVFRWTDARGSELLEFGGRIHDTTPDGSVIIGDFVTYLHGEYVVGQINAYVWDECYGLRALTTWLPQRFGLNLSGVFRIEEPRGISHDGRTIVGTGYHIGSQIVDAFVLSLPPLIEGDLDDDGSVDAIDLGILTTAIGQQAAGEWFCRRADLSGDGVVDLLDIALFQRLIAPPPPCPTPPPGDLDGDCTTDAHDAAFFADCMTGPGQPADANCLPADLDADEDVDLADFVALQRSPFVVNP